MRKVVPTILAGLCLAIACAASGCHQAAPRAPMMASPGGKAAAPRETPIPPNAPPTEAQFLQNNPSMPASEREAMIKQMQKQAPPAGNH